MIAVDAAALRRLIREALPTDPVQYDTPEKSLVYVPRRHAEVLEVNRMLVVGERGTGKSFWARSFVDPAILALAREVTHGAALPEGMVVKRGWDSQLAAGDGPPDRQEIEGLLNGGASAYQIWTAIYLSAIEVGEIRSRSTWGERVALLRDDVTAWGRLWRAASERQEARGVHALVIFDELDRVSLEPRKRLDLLRGLLQLLLDLRNTRFLRAKVFVRPDMIEAREIRAFPDASKVVSGGAELRWDAIDLYALLWHRLVNHAEAGPHLRAFASAAVSAEFETRGGVFQIPEALRSESDMQRRLLHALTGPAMGPNRKRGIPYVWLPNHLKDARGTLTVRSFLIALAEAAQDEGHLDHEFPLHWDALKEGVRRASERRRSELEEDLPWADAAMSALEGLGIPCEDEKIRERWSERGTLAAVHASERPPALRSDDELGSLRDALKAAGVFDERTDGRWNVPDVYRVAYKLPLRGGVSPRKR